MSVLTILTLFGLAALTATSPVYDIINYKNHNILHTDYWFAVKHEYHNQNSKRNNESDKSVKIDDDSTSKTDKIVDNKDNNVFIYYKLGPVIDFDNRSTPDPNFFDNTDPRNDRGEWDGPEDVKANVNESKTNGNNSTKEDGKNYAGHLDDFFNVENIKKNDSKPVDSENKEDSSKTSKDESKIESDDLKNDAKNEKIIETQIITSDEREQNPIVDKEVAVDEKNNKKDDNQKDKLPEVQSR